MYWFLAKIYIQISCNSRHFLRTMFLSSWGKWQPGWAHLHLHTRYCLILLDTGRYCQILLDMAGYCWILPDTARYYTILPDIAWYCLILPNTAQCPPILLLHAWYCPMKPDTAGYCNILCFSLFFFVFARLSPSSSFSWAKLAVISFSLLPPNRTLYPRTSSETWNLTSVGIYKLSRWAGGTRTVA